jgi:hypothetical protein
MNSQSSVEAFEVGQKAMACLPAGALIILDD